MHKYMRSIVSVIVVGTFLLLICSCGGSRQRLQHAHDVIFLADSLRAAGQNYDDSIQLAVAVTILRPFRFFYSDDYARANYYYGKFLRRTGNQPAAMQAFLEATHTHSDDYEIIGRTYANMAYMCRLATEHTIAYVLYEKSAKYFHNLRNDTLYYYSLNNMAFELSHITEYEEALFLLNDIQLTCTIQPVVTKTYETKAILYYERAMYDSAIVCVNQLQKFGNSEPTGYNIKAQSFWGLEEKDSAICYASQALACPCSLNDSVNMLYILSHNPQNKDIDSVLSITSERADKQFLYTHRQESLAHAIEILKQDLSRPFDWRWLYLLVTIIALLGTIVGIRYIVRRHNRLDSDTKLYSKNCIETLEHVCSALSQLPTDQIIKELCWRDYEQMCSIVNARMFNIADILINNDPCLTPKEIRLCVLVLINLSRKQMAELLLYAESGIGKFKHSTAHKLGTTGKEMRDFLLQKCISHIQNL